MLDEEKDNNNPFNREEFFDMVQLNIEQSPAQLLLLTLKYAVKNRLSRSALIDLLKFLNHICGKKVVPDTSYLLDKLCKGGDQYSLHAVCPTCEVYLGKFEDLNQNGVVNCKNCHKTVDTKNPSNPCYYLIINPSKEISDILQVHEEYYDNIMFKRRHKKNRLKDIYDGKMYRRFVRNLNDDDKHSYATMTFNTDGASVFESTNASIWPVYLMPNEIPIEARLKNSIVCGFWFGQSKPNMLVFLNTFVETMNKLSENGIDCTIKNEERNIKVFALVAVVDTIARNKMNGTCQFNGKNGCDWCLQEGFKYGGSLRYPYEDPPAEMRDKDTWYKYAEQAIKEGVRIFGVEHMSPLLYLNNFDIVHGFTPDYLHCYLEGVVEQITERILKKLSPKERGHLDQLLLAIKAPRVFGKLTRSMEKRSDWKALDWEKWVLYYSLPIFEEVVEDKNVVKHWALLVNSLHILLSTNISNSELKKADDMLKQFVREISEKDLYSMREYTYNVHQLLHICESVKNWGPLWAHSTFPFETANNKLIKAIHCANGVIPQIIKFMDIQRTIQNLTYKISSETSIKKMKFHNNFSTNQVKNAFKLTSVTYFGRGKQVPKDIKDRYEISNRTKMYNKIVTKGFLLTPSSKINKRSCDYFAQLNDGKFVKILRCLANSLTEEEKIICQVVKTKKYKYSEFINRVDKLSDATCIETSEISKPSIVMKTKRGLFISSLPNVLHY